MTAHSRIGNRLYVQGICPFARCESRLNHPATGGRAFYIYDKRSGKLLAGPHKTQARAWPAKVYYRGSISRMGRAKFLKLAA